MATELLAEYWGLRDPQNTAHYAKEFRGSKVLYTISLTHALTWTSKEDAQIAAKRYGLEAVVFWNYITTARPEQLNAATPQFPCYSCANIGDEAPRCNQWQDCHKYLLWIKSMETTE